MAIMGGKSVKGDRVFASSRTLDCYYKLKRRIAEGVGSMAVSAQGASGVSGAARSRRAGELQAYRAIDA